MSGNRGVPGHVVASDAYRQPLGPQRPATHPVINVQAECGVRGFWGDRVMVGYARISTRGQDLALQLDALQRAGCERVYKDVGSGTIRRRPELEACLDYLRAGDTWSCGGSIASAGAFGISWS